MVSRAWRTVASDASLAWFQVISMPILKDNDDNFTYRIINPCHPIDGTPVEFAKVHKSTTQQRQSEKQSFFGSYYNQHPKFVFTDKLGVTLVEGACVYPPSFTRRSGSFKLELHENEESLSPLWTNSPNYIAELVEICKQNPRLWRCELLNDRSSFNFALEVNIMELETLVDKGGKVPLADILSYSAYKYFKTKAPVFNYNEPHIPMKSVTTQKQPSGFGKSIKLYKYQLDAVNWMKSVEEDASVGFDCVHVIPWREAKTSVLFKYPFINEIVSMKNVKEHTQRVYPRGGILADEMGLGKTTEIIGLILSHPGDPAVIDTSNFTSGPKDDELLSLFFDTNATLVICPEHLVKQWHEEIEKTTRPNLNVVAVSDMRGLKSFTYGDIVTADVVIVPITLLTNKSYANLGKFTCTQHGYEDCYMHSRDEQYKECLEKMWKLGSELLKVKGPILDYFNWRRIVLDEAHDLMGRHWDSKISRFKARYWWYVSGTPVTSEFILQRIKEVLQFPNSKCEILLWEYVDIFLSNLYWRNTKESVKDEYEVPSIVEDLVLLDLTPVEKLAYQCTDHSKLLTASHAGLGVLGDTMTISELRIELVDYLESLIKNNQATVKSNQLAIETSENEIEYIKSQKPKPSNASKRMKRERESITKSNMSIEAANNSILEETELKDKLLALNEACYKGPDMSSQAEIPELDEHELEEQDSQSNSENATSKETAISLPFSVIVDMTIPQLKEELKNRGIKTNSKQRKNDLQKLLKDSATQNEPVEQEQEREEQSTTKRKNKSVDNATTAKKAKVTSNSNSVTTKGKGNVRTTADKVREQNVLKWLVEQEGTKLGNLIFYLKRVWEETPAAKVIIFSRFTTLLDKISALLSARNVNHTSLKGNIIKKAQNMRTFKKESEVRVLLLDLTKVSAGTNIIEATHVIFMEPAASKGQESQAIARAYRQGQTVRVTVVRFIVRDTVDYELHMSLHGYTEETSQDGATPSIKRTASLTNSGQPRFQRTSSLISIDATGPPLPGSMDGDTHDNVNR